MALAEHNDSGYIEQLIHASRHRLAHGMSDEDVQRDLVEHNVNPSLATYVIAAAKILLGDT